MILSMPNFQSLHRHTLAFSFIGSLLTVQGQQIMFAQDYKIKSALTSDKLLSSALLMDESTQEHLLILSGTRDMKFYLLDKDWKVLDQFDHPFVKNSPMAHDGFSVPLFKHDGKRWMLVTHHAFDNYQEVIDFAGKTQTLKGELFADKNDNIMETRITDGDDLLVLYVRKGDKANVWVTRFTKDMKMRSYPMRLESALPRDRSSHFTAEEIYTASSELDSVTITSIAATRNKVHLMVREDAFVFGIVDGTEAELTSYDKRSGEKLGTVTCSLADQLPADRRAARCNPAMLLDGQTLWLLVAQKDGGVLGAFDALTGKLIQAIKYDELSPLTLFSYPPATYETAPNAGRKLEERVRDISMSTFCSELFNHSCGLSIAPFSPAMKILKVGNWDQKDVLTGSNRTGSSALLYVYTSAGLLIDRPTGNFSTLKTTWAEANENVDAQEHYAKVVVPVDTPSAEYYQKRSMELGRHQLDGVTHVVYWYGGQVKVAALK